MLWEPNSVSAPTLPGSSELTTLTSACKQEDNNSTDKSIFYLFTIINNFIS